MESLLSWLPFKFLNFVIKRLRKQTNKTRNYSQGENFSRLVDMGCLPFTWKIRKFQLENQMVRIIPFGVYFWNYGLLVKVYCCRIRRLTNSFLKALSTNVASSNNVAIGPGTYICMNWPQTTKCRVASNRCRGNKKAKYVIVWIPFLCRQSFLTCLSFRYKDKHNI